MAADLKVTVTRYARIDPDLYEMQFLEHAIDMWEPGGKSRSQSPMSQRPSNLTEPKSGKQQQTSGPKAWDVCHCLKLSLKREAANR